MDAGTGNKAEKVDAEEIHFSHKASYLHYLTPPYSHHLLAQAALLGVSTPPLVLHLSWNHGPGEGWPESSFKSTTCLHFPSLKVFPSHWETKAQPGQMAPGLDAS